MKQIDLIDDLADAPAMTKARAPKPKVKMKPPRVIEVPDVLDETEEVHELDHVRHEPGHVLAPGLFRSLSKGEYKHQKLDVTYEYGNGNRLEFSGPEPLGVPELRILQGLIAMAGPSGILLTPEPKTERGQQLRLLLKTEFEAKKKNALIAKGSYRNLAKVAGYKNDADTLAIQTVIERLWKVSIIAQVKGQRMGFRLLSEYASDTAEGHLFVALNPMIADAILGDKARHCRIELSEVRGLESDVARLIHQRLCGWINAGQMGRVSLETLISYAWPVPAAKDAAARKRRQRVRTALPELVTVGWTVIEYVTGKFEITRPERKPARAEV